MKGKNRLMALVVVLALMLSTVPAFAAQFDFVNKDTRDRVGFFEALDDTDLFLDIYDNMEKYVIEVGGKYYDVAAVNARTADGISIGDAVADMEPVDLDEPAEELEVVSVSAITKTGVTVIVEPVKEASEEATIEVKNSKGEVVAVEPLVVEVGETELVFDFVEEQKEEALVGVWKVEGVEYNFDVIKQLADIKEEAATPVNEIKFLAALNAAGIKNVDENRLGEYATKLVEKDEEIETLEDVQAIIDEVNKGEATKEEQDAAVKAVKEAKNQIQLLAALEAGFERVNADWIVEYATDSTNGLLEKDNLTFEGIQNAVDVINKEKVEEKITAAEAKLDSKLVSEAKTLVENYIKEDGKNETTKKGMLDQLAIHQAVINVNLANTNNKLDAAFKALAELVEDTVFDIETVKPELLKAYRDAIAEEAKKETPANKTAENIQTIVSAVNQEAAEAEAALKINFSVASDGGTNADVEVNVDNLNNEKRLVTVTGDYLALEEYKANNDTPPATAKWIGLVIGLQDKDNANITGKIKLTLDGDDVREVELGKLDGQAENEFWYYFVPEAGGNTKTLDFEVKDAEGKVVQKDGFTIKFVDELSDEGALVMMNEAEDVNDMMVAISEMAALKSTDAYINLSSAAKLEVAEIVLAAREKATDKEFASVTDATTAITSNVTAYTQFLSGVNGATTIGTMNTALDKVVFPEFQKLSASEKIAKAELVLNALNELRAELEDPTAEFETIAEIKAAAGL